MTVFRSIFALRTGGRVNRGDSSVLIATLLCAALSCAWTLVDWSALRQLQLPDTDDLVRLAQMRDWIGGQTFADLSQHRLGLGGASMHWSRIGDVGPALLIVALTPLLSEHWATVAAVMLYPALLFLILLLLVGRIARGLGGEAAVMPALLLAAVAYPGSALFLPGRIDHHGLQAVLLAGLVAALIRRAGIRTGAVAGLVAAVSLVVGLEIAPAIVAALTVAGLRWIAAEPGEDERAIGIGIGLGMGTLLAIAARPGFWPDALCDAFTPATSRATLVVAGAWLLLGLAGRWLPTGRARLVAAGAGALAVAAAALQVAPACRAGPYAAVDPFLVTVWLSQVTEAQPLISGSASLGERIANVGLLLVGLGIGAASAVRAPDWNRLLLLGVLGAGLATSFTQLRGAAPVAALAVVPIAALIAEARGALRPLLWLLGAGIVYALIGRTIDGRAPPLTSVASCAPDALVTAVKALPPGRFAVPIDRGVQLIGRTHHATLAAPYHRNGAGNLAMYRLFLAPSDKARDIARASGVDYIALCDGDLMEPPLRTMRRGSLAEQLQASDVPDWLQPLPAPRGLYLFRVR